MEFLLMANLSLYAIFSLSKCWKYFIIAFHCSSVIWWKLGIRTSRLGRIIDGLLKKLNSQSGLALAPCVFRFGGPYSAAPIWSTNWPPKSSIKWQPWQLNCLTNLAPFCAISSTRLWALIPSSTLLALNPNMAVVMASISVSLKSKFGIFSLSNAGLTLSRSKILGLSNFASNHAKLVWAISWCSPKSNFIVGLEPSSVNSVPIGLAFSNPSIVWHPKQP